MRVNVEKCAIWQLDSSLAFLDKLRHLVTLPRSPHVASEKRGAPVNAEDCFLVCRTLSGTYSVDQVGEKFIAEWHVPSAFVVQPANASGCCPGGTLVTWVPFHLASEKFKDPFFVIAGRHIPSGSYLVTQVVVKDVH